MKKKLIGAVIAAFMMIASFALVPAVAPQMEQAREFVGPVLEASAPVVEVVADMPFLEQAFAPLTPALETMLSELTPQHTLAASSYRDVGGACSGCTATVKFQTGYGGTQIAWHWRRSGAYGTTYGTSYTTLNCYTGNCTEQHWMGADWSTTIYAVTVSNPSWVTIHFASRA